MSGEAFSSVPVKTSDSKHFHVELDRLSDVFTGTLEKASPDIHGTLAPMAAEADPSFKQAILRARAAVVQLKGVKKSGTGFFVTATGIVVTNAHVARGENS